ncbi:MAG: leucine-rich repeat domain-containing protein [Eubacterium sp.]|nr:leucine-rich repeat domain-containing protein [Eubacterium sp.]
MTKVLRRTAAVFLMAALMAVLAMLAGTVTAHAANIDDGIINSTCRWEYWRDSSGTYILSIVSTDSDGGRIPDYVWSEQYGSTAPWAKYSDNIEEIRFEYIVEVGDYAFYKYPKLTEVVIHYVKRIGNHAFAWSGNVRGIFIYGDNCVIEDDAFAFCEDVTMNVVHLEGVKSIGETAFEEVDCRELELEEGIESIGYGAFNNNEALDFVVIPKSCKSIGQNAFWACPKLTEAVILSPACTFQEYSFDKDHLRTLFVTKDSTPQKLAKQYGFPYVIFGDVGAGTLDLTKGDKTYTEGSDDVGYYTVMSLEGLAMTKKINYKEVERSLSRGLYHFDLDKDGTYDIELDVNYSTKIYAIKVLPGRSVGGNMTFRLTQADLDKIGGNILAGYYGTLTLKFTKFANPMTVKSKTATVKYSKLRKKSQTIKKSKAYTIRNAKGKVTYKLSSVSKSKFKKYFKVSSSGKITVKKGLKKGTYKVKVKVTAAGDSSYNPLTKKVTVKVKVK